MKKFKVLVTADCTQSAEVVVEAEDDAEAAQLATTHAELHQGELKWEPDEGNYLHPYIADPDTAVEEVKCDTSSVFNIETLDDAHKAKFNAQLPWIFEIDTGDGGYEHHCCATEEEACSLQRVYRRALGFDPITGETATTEELRNV